MSGPSPEKALPREVEPRKFAHLGAELTGTVPVASLERLAQAVLAVEKISASVYFDTTEQNERVVTGRVSAQLQRQCQRCLEPVATQVDCELALAVVRSEDEAKALNSRYDPWIVAEDSADLYAVVEDEVLLTMPFVAMHDTACIDASLYQHGPAPEQTTEDAKAENPFAVLKQLKEPKN